MDPRPSKRIRCTQAHRRRLSLAGQFDFKKLGQPEAEQPDQYAIVVEQALESAVAAAPPDVFPPLVRPDLGRNRADEMIGVVGFFDAGVAWDRNSRPSGLGGNGTRPWVRSFGGGIRVNAFGYAIVKLVAARPFDRADNSWRFVFGIRPGF